MFTSVHNGIEVFGGFSSLGHLNAVLYPPGVACEAMDGCPVNPVSWSVVYWYPGLTTFMRCFGDHAAALADIRNTIR